MSDNRRYYGGTGDPYSRQGRGLGTGRFKLFLIIGLAMAAFQAFKFYTSTQTNPITGEEQRVQWNTEEEIQLGLQAAPQMAQEYGGLHPDQRAQELVDRVGQKLVQSTIAAKTGYPYDFHLLADNQVVNAFALPGGQCFITAALFTKLKNEDQLAGVLGHEIGHVIHRHGAERSASQGFIQGLIQSVLIGTGGDQALTQVANMVGQYSSMKYGRDQELESDDFGVRLMVEAGYDPHHLIGVMDILEEASGGQKVPEFQSTHPSPENRREKIKSAIEKYAK
ncbi:MAG: M48 family metallopeptidase [Saprospiraceae bacterium]|nr:M48 family metallopeptidase [Saprospiraceae bacterium]MBK7220543.1 M48 family metallopeptidase [Saprospiraceae bacterium]MBK7790826.1 M48 family metallopeptidase [Saprospiraceae bacterium]MBK8109427.1 M48 family metallopeptidase [Saprospiraceae bacterium]MBK8848958.1 M48 family metallopeptidase [Saprospiraceae bacterium]